LRGAVVGSEIGREGSEREGAIGRVLWHLFRG